MYRTATCVSLALALGQAAPASAESPRHDGTPLTYTDASNWLQRDFDACQLESYPTVTMGAVKLRPLARFTSGRGDQHRATLTIDAYAGTGAPTELSRPQRTWAACVRRRFQRRTYLVHADARSRRPDREVTLRATWDDPVDARGGLDQRLARAYVIDRAPAIRRRCVGKRTPYRATITIAADGRVADVALAPDDRAAGCVGRQLRARLRFPATTAASQLTVAL